MEHEQDKSNEVQASQLRQADVSRRSFHRELKRVVDAWEKLPSGMVRPKDVERWLEADMAPAIQRLRRILNGG